MPTPDRSRLPHDPQLRLTCEREGGRIVVRAAGELDLATAEDFISTVRKQLERAPVLLDLRELSFLGSSGIHAIDALLREVERNGWALAMHPVLQRSVERVLELTGVLSILPLERES